MRISKLAFGSGLFDRITTKWLLAAVAILFAPCLRAGLTNPGFESGTANFPPPSPWVTQFYKNPGIANANYPPQTFADLGLIAGGVANTVIVASGSGPGSQADLALGTPASLRWPLFGNQSAVINGPDSSATFTAGANQNVNVLTQTMTIGAADVDPSDGKIHVRFSIAPVIQYGNHPAVQEAYTFVEVTNITQNTQLFHAFYNVDYDSFDVWKLLVVAGSNFYYTDWQAIDISPGSPAINIGDTVKVTLVAAGCVPGAHEAHLYVDSSAQTSGISVAATGPATVDAPGTITYTYSYGNHAGTSNPGVVIDVTTPPLLTFVSLTPPPGATCVPLPAGGSGTITCSFSGPLPAGVQGSFTTTFNVPANATSPIHLRNYDIHSSTQLLLLGPPVDTAVKYVTATTLTSNANPATLGQSVTFTATVTGQSPTGTVTFNDGTTAICATVALSSGSATCMISALAVGSHSITAVYGGDTNNVASTSNIVTQQVNQASSATSLVSATNPSTFGQSVTFTATVTGQAPTGTVTFNDATTAICATVALSSGSATCMTSALAAGSRSITAVYGGDTNNAASTSNTLTQQVNQSLTTTSLATSCMTTFVENQPFTMTASVSGAVPTGNVSFSTQANVVVCGNLPLSSGSASCTTNALAVVGSATEQGYSLTANYVGDVDNAPSTSAAIMVTVLKASDVVFRNAFDVDLPSCPIE
jgi:hypothetical protein